MTGRFVPALARIGELPALAAIRESLPWSFIGLVAALPVFMALTQSGTVPQRLSAAELPAFAIMGATLAVVLAYRVALHLKLNRAIVVAATCAAFALSLPRPIGHADVLTYLRSAGESALFLAIVLALIAGAACAYTRRFFGMTGEIAGAILVVAAAAGLASAGISLSHELAVLLQPLGRLGDSYAALVIVVLVETLLWIVGVHGPATLAAIVTPLYLTLQFQNTAAHAQHDALPHIVTTSFFLFVFPGGAGATLPIAFLLLRSRVRRLRLLARATVLPAFFNINEPLLFGLPIIMNPYLIAPFVGVPLITATVSYIAVASGAVARPVFYLPSAIPTPIATFLATLDPRAVVLALLNIAIAFVLYAPFVHAYERSEAAA